MELFGLAGFMHVDTTLIEIGISTPSLNLFSSDFTHFEIEIDIFSYFHLFLSIFSQFYRGVYPGIGQRGG